MIALFLLTLVIFPIQYWFAKSVKEPYPALVMPAFEGSMITEANLYQVQSADVVVEFGEGQVKQMTLRGLFFDVPSSHVLPMAKIGFYPRAQFDPASSTLHGSTPMRKWMKANVLPGLVVGEVHRSFRSADDALSKAWLKQRLEQLLPGRSPRSVEFVWHKRTIIPNDVERAIPILPSSNLKVTFE